MKLYARAKEVLRVRWPEVFFWLVVVGMLGVRLGGPLRYLYPVAAMGVAAYLLRRSTALYLGFVIWLWFLTPIVRRVADLYAGWQDPSTILLAPYLATGISALLLLRRLMWWSQHPDERPAGLGVFALVVVGVAIGIPMGLMSGSNAALLETMNWMLPPIFGCYVASQYRELPAMERHIGGTFAVAGFISGAYGIYQFGGPLPWDVNWMQLIEMDSIGRPEAFEVRVFGTMHSPGIFAFFMVFALVFWLARPTMAGVATAGVAGVALLLSQVRSGWLALIFSAGFAIISLRGLQLVRVLALGAIAASLAAVFLLTPEMSELVNSRISTMERLEDDESAVARITGHRLVVEAVADNPLGSGIGQSNPRVDLYISTRDSVIAATLIQFGLVGALLYFLGVALLLWQSWTYYRRTPSPEGRAMAATAIGVTLTSPLGVVTAGPIGMCVWLAGGLAIASRHQQNLQARILASTRRPSRVREPLRGRIPA